jgi:DNA helicase-2/ATP-dependent DNA helicase PcrA
VSTPRPPVPEQLLVLLNAEQRQAVTTLEGPLLILAGPGSGKTRVLTHRIAALLATGTPPHGVLALTFTNKAAGEMRERLAHLLGEGSPLPWAGTFHAACARILRPAASLVGLPSGFSIAATDDSRRVLRQVVTTGLRTSPEPAEIRELASAISRAKNRLTSLGELTTEAYGERAAEFAAAYQTEMLRLGQVDFDDLLLFTRTLLRDHAEVRTRLHQRLEHLLVDEYQDTNNVQYDILRSLDGRGNICVVGDADQAIYGFRSASAGVVDRFRADYPQRTEIRLGQNYRSTKPIVALASAVIAKGSPGRPSIWTERDGGEVPALHVFPSDLDEARFVVERIAALGPGADVAVLMRTNSQSRPIEERLVAAGVAYDIVGSLRFYDRTEVKDALAWCRAAANPDDALALIRAAGVPRRGVGDGALDQLRTVADQHGLALVTALLRGSTEGWFTGRHQAALGRLADDLRSVMALVPQGPVPVLRRVLEIGVRDHHARGEGGAERIANLDELLAAAESFPASPDALVRWLEHVALLGADAESETKLVRLMTVHAAKGREFDSVFLVGVEEGLFPHDFATTSAEVEEERRLLYVAITRARHHLTLTACTSRFRFGQHIAASPSRFLTGLPTTLLRRDRSAPDLFSSPPRPSLRLPHSSSRPSASSRPAAGSRSSSTPRPAPASPVAAPGPRLDPAQVAVGLAVRHRVFGEGTIHKVTGSRVEVLFGGTTRILDLEFAPLEQV